MHSGNSTGPMKRKLGMLSQVLSRVACNCSSSIPYKLPSIHVLFCWCLVVGVLLLMVSGCGRYKEELESAKQQNEKLNSDVKRLTEEIERLKRETSRLSDESKTLSDQNTKMQRELGSLNKANAALSAENTQIKNKSSVAEEEIAALRREKANLAQEVEKLKRPVAEMAPPSTPPTVPPPEVMSGQVKQQEELNPCDEVLAFMKASEGIVRQHKGRERTKLLEQVREQYAPRMKGAPEKAVRAAENWVKEGTKFWDRSSEDATFRLLQLRNTVLDTCGKSPGAAGFR